jgi:acylphosphatase
MLCARQDAASALRPVKLTANAKNSSAFAMDATRLSVTIYRFVSEHKQARRFFVSGTVQGVGFRYFTQHVAQRLHLTGYAKNLPDGRVEVYALGAADDLAKLRSALERGPMGAGITEVAEEHAAIDTNYEFGFVINY